MASAATEYKKLRDQCNKFYRETGKRDPKMWNDKAAAGNAAQAERRAANHDQKRALQEAYIGRFPEAVQPEVRMRLHEPAKFAAMLAKRRAEGK